MAEAKSLRDQTIGENIARIRGNLSQQALADLMRERGHDWTQATVWAVEKGRRPIRLAEAEVLAGILQVDISSLLELPTWIALLNAVDNLAQAENDLRDAAERYERSMYSVAYYADLLLEHDTMSRDVETALMGLESYNLDLTAVDFVRDRVMNRIPGEAGGKYMSQYLNAAVSEPGDGKRQAKS